MSKPLMFLKSMYFRERYTRLDGGRSKSVKTCNDAIIITYKNEDTGDKKIKIIEEPSIHYYMANENVDTSKHLNYVNQNDVIKVTSKYSNLLLDLATTVGQERSYYDSLKKGERFSLNRFHQLNHIFSSDVNIDDYYKKAWIDKFPDVKNILSKGFYDIEVDNRNYQGFPEEDIAPCPVNIITYMDNDMKISSSYVLRDLNNPLNVEFELERVEEMKALLKNELSTDFEYEFVFFDTELELLIAFFNDMNYRFNPDYALAWNMKFDLLTMINRLILLKADPVQIISHKDYPDQYKTCFFKKDTLHGKASERNDTFTISSMISYVDPLLLFAQIRKGLGERESYRLNDIAMEELGEGKLDYSEEGDLASLIDKDFFKFVYYNIKDVYLLVKLEQKNQDVDMVHAIAEITKTRVDKAFKKTISLKMFAYEFYLNKGFVMGNNANMSYDNSSYNNTDGDTNFKGAIVLDPANINAEGITIIEGLKNLRIFGLSCDFDYSSLYPSIILCNNLDGTTIKYKIVFDDKAVVDLKKTDEDNIAGRFLDKYTTHNFTRLCTEYFKLPSLEEVIKLLE